MDRPAHVRAGSGLARIPGGLVVIQDDSNFLALIDPLRPRAARAIPLPPGLDGRRQFGDSTGNKHLKLDLEACFVTPGSSPLFVAFGSGSTPARESVVLLSGFEHDTLEARVILAPALYARLRATPAFAGSEMNIEGALLLGEWLRLFCRGNGAVNGNLAPVNSTCDLPWSRVFAHLGEPGASPPPAPVRIEAFTLGALHGVPLGFTDAADWKGRVLFTAAAEDSPDSVRDGPVTGSVIGIVEERGVARWAPITDVHGATLREKAEGLLVADAERGTFWVVADADDETRPSELWQIQLGGPWQ